MGTGAENLFGLGVFNLYSAVTHQSGIWLDKNIQPGRAVEPLITDMFDVEKPGECPHWDLLSTVGEVLGITYEELLQFPRFCGSFSGLGKYAGRTTPCFDPMTRIFHESPFSMVSSGVICGRTCCGVFLAVLEQIQDIVTRKVSNVSEYPVSVTIDQNTTKEDVQSIRELLGEHELYLSQKEVMDRLRETIPSVFPEYGQGHEDIGRIMNNLTNKMRGLFVRESPTSLFADRFGCELAPPPPVDISLIRR